MEKLIDISSYPVAQVLDVLLQDKTTKKNIIWATDTYAEFGEEFTDKVQLDANAILRRLRLIKQPPNRSHPPPHPEVAGGTGAANEEKSRGVHASMALQSDEQSLR